MLVSWAALPLLLMPRLQLVAGAYEIEQVTDLHTFGWGPVLARNAAINRGAGLVRYTRRADRKRLAREGMNLLSREQEGNEN